VPPGPGLVTVGSLEEVGFDLLEGVVTGNFEDPGQAVTEKSR